MPSAAGRGKVGPEGLSNNEGEKEMSGKPMEMTKISIFDTTLRDGEQSPGCSLTVPEKIEVAHQLARLGVDVIEAGFPISSPGDFKAVQTIARQVRGPMI